MDYESIGEGLRGAERGVMSLQERGAQLSRLAADLQGKFSGLWSLLGSAEIPSDNLAWIVLGREDSEAHGPGAYEGCIVHHYPGETRENPSGIVETDFFVMVDFVPDNPGRQKRMEVDSEIFGRDEAAEGVHALFKEDHVWTKDELTEAETWCSEYVPEGQRTLDLFLEAACDPDLNPAVAERAQAYRDSLLAVA